jgi:hypothetical protein
MFFKKKFKKGKFQNRKMESVTGRFAQDSSNIPYFMGDLGEIQCRRYRHNADE